MSWVCARPLPTSSRCSAARPRRRWGGSYGSVYFGRRPGIRFFKKPPSTPRSTKNRKRDIASTRRRRASRVSQPWRNCGWSGPRLIDDGLRAPWNLQVSHSYAQGFLHLSRVRLDRALQRAVRPDATLGRGITFSDLQLPSRYCVA
jgi:hypothetical protein